MGKYYEEFNVGDRFETHGRTLTDGDLSALNGLLWLTEPIHNDRPWATGQMGFKERLFPGVCILALGMGLLIRTGVLDDTVLLLLGINDVKFISPLFPGDTIRSTVEVVAKRESRSRPDAGIVTFKQTVRNHEDKAVSEYTATLLV
ncbi:MAG: MaoC/PaaZ C-terminal domain-containing protein, partial [Chloroflexota bacterium]